LKGNYTRIIRLLSVLPWVLSVGFLFSFYWDFPEANYWIGSWEISFEGILRILSVSGLIGFLTNWIAITMLFRPRQRRPLLGQGLIPSQKHRIAEKLADSVNRNLINAEQIHKKMADSGTLAKIVDFVETKITDLSENPAFREDLYIVIRSIIAESLHDQQLRTALVSKIIEHLDNSIPENSLERMAFKTYRNLRGSHLTAIVDNVLLGLPDTIYNNRRDLDELIESIPARLSRNRLQIEAYLLDTVESVLKMTDIRGIVLDNLNNYDEGRLEHLIKESTMEQLSYIKYLGGLLGVLGGLVIWNPIIALSFLAGNALVILALDISIVRWKSSKTNKLT